MPNETLAERLEVLHQRWHQPLFLGTDPLMLVLEADSPDREVVAFLVSCLAVGRASLIVEAGRTLLERIGKPVAHRLTEAEQGSWDRVMEGFVYRFFSASKVAALLDSLGDVLRRFGTLERAWSSTGNAGWDALAAFSSLFHRPDRDLGVLVPTPQTSGAAKRLNLFLRWMVRRDGIDPGGWTHLIPAQLYMPVDTHVLQWARAEGLTARNTADQRACWEITEALKRICPQDPLRYDFAITRAGMAAKNTLF